MRKDTRKSAGRMATYSQKMKENGFKQVSFFLSPKSYATLTEMTLNERSLNRSLVGTNNGLLECLSGKEFVYDALKGLANPNDAIEAIELTIKMFNVMLEEEKKRKLECQKELDYKVENDLMPTPDEIASTIEAEELLLRQGLD